MMGLYSTLILTLLTQNFHAICRFLKSRTANGDNSEDYYAGASKYSLAHHRILVQRCELPVTTLMSLVF
jgi:hypothetical protein